MRLKTWPLQTDLLHQVSRKKVCSIFFLNLKSVCTQTVVSALLYMAVKRVASMHCNLSLLPSSQSRKTAVRRATFLFYLLKNNFHRMFYESWIYDFFLIFKVAISVFLYISFNCLRIKFSLYRPIFQSTTWFSKMATIAVILNNTKKFIYSGFVKHVMNTTFVLKGMYLMTHFNEFFTLCCAYLANLKLNVEFWIKMINLIKVSRFRNKIVEPQILPKKQRLLVRLFVCVLE